MFCSIHALIFVNVCAKSVLCVCKGIDSKKTATRCALREWYEQRVWCDVCECEEQRRQKAQKRGRRQRGANETEIKSLIYDKIEMRWLWAASKMYKWPNFCGNDCRTVQFRWCGCHNRQHFPLCSCDPCEIINWPLPQNISMRVLFWILLFSGLYFPLLLLFFIRRSYCCCWNWGDSVVGCAAVSLIPSPSPHSLQSSFAPCHSFLRLNGFFQPVLFLAHSPLSLFIFRQRVIRNIYTRSQTTKQIIQFFMEIRNDCWQNNNNGVETNYVQMNVVLYGRGALLLLLFFSSSSSQAKPKIHFYLYKAGQTNSLTITMKWARQNKNRPKKNDEEK